METGHYYYKGDKDDKYLKRALAFIVLGLISAAIGAYVLHFPADFPVLRNFVAAGFTSGFGGFVFCAAKARVPEETTSNRFFRLKHRAIEINLEEKLLAIDWSRVEPQSLNNCGIPPELIERAIVREL